MRDRAEPPAAWEIRKRRTRIGPVALWVAGLALTCAGPAAQSPLWVIERTGQRYWEVFGAGDVCWAGDIDGDGCSDIAVIVPDVGLNGRGELRIYSGRSGAVIRRFKSPPRSFGWGRLAIIKRAGDLNGDGVPDLLIGVPEDYNAGARAGAGYVVSGKDGRVIHRFLGLAAEDNFGQSVAVLGDVDGDRVPDVAVGTSSSSESMAIGYVRIYSGRTGKLLRHLLPPLPSVAWGGGMVGVGDTNRDGFPDLLVVAPATNFASKKAGSVYLYSGKDWSLLRRIDGPRGGQYFGHSLAAAGDVNRDGYADFIVGSMYHPGLPLRYCGNASLISGKDGSILQFWWSRICKSWHMDGFGQSVAGVGDVDGDGWGDVAVGAPFEPPGRVYVFSGRTGAELWHVDGDVKTWRGGTGFGDYVSGGGDANRDGWPDLVIPEPGASWPPHRSRLWVIGSHFLSLRADKSALSLSRHESLTFQLDARPLNLGRIYLLLGSVSGTAPGLQLGTVRLPLIADPYFWLTFFHPNGTMLSPSLGVLDGKGRASSRLTLVRGLPAALVGRTLYHAYLVLDPNSGRLSLASIPVGTQVKP